MCKITKNRPSQLLRRGRRMYGNSLWTVLAGFELVERFLLVWIMGGGAVLKQVWYIVSYWRDGLYPTTRRPNKIHLTKQLIAHDLGNARSCNLAQTLLKG